MTKGALLILVNDNNEALLQHKDANAPTHPNKWCLFGGRIEEGEIARQTVHREFLEELEWNLGEIVHFADYADNDVFLAWSNKPASTLRKKLHEGSDLGYFSESDIKNMNVAEPHLKALQDYFSGQQLTTVHFICRGNALRSIIAEVYLNSLSLRGVKVLSSGTFATVNVAQNKERQKETRALLKRHNLLQFAKQSFAKQLTDERLAEGDVTVCMNKHVFDGYQKPYILPSKTVFWNIPDIGDAEYTPTTSQQLQAFEEEIFTTITHSVDEFVAKNLSL